MQNQTWKLGPRQTAHDVSLLTSLQDSEWADTLADTHIKEELAHWLLDYTFSNPLPSFSWAEASEAEFDYLRPDVEMRVILDYEGIIQLIT